MTSPGHRVVTAPDLPAPRGYAHAVVAADGRTVHLGGQIAQEEDGSVREPTFVGQFDVASRNLVTALHAAGGEPVHLVSLTVYVTDMDAYRGSAKALGEVWRTHFGPRYPAMALIGVASLVDPAALVEISGVAVIP